jgi:phosphoribosylaminoimidazole carboxylase (NCAIR synthetase)
VNVESLAALEKRGVQVQPSSETIRIIQDKFVQKNVRNFMFSSFQTHFPAFSHFHQIFAPPGK